MSEKGGSKVMSDANKAGGTGKRTLVEEGTAIKGNMSSSCPIVVMGKIEGEISGPSMEIAESGVVSGKIKVGAFSSCGELAGELDAETVQLAGLVRDETVIRARLIEVAGAGATLVFGECELSIGDEPDKRKAVEEVTGARKPAPAVAAPAPAVAAPAPAAAAPHAAPPPVPDRKRRNSAAVSVALKGQESGPST
jgi:cytoskeletal protein CcmA (bactofilin family)